MKWEKEKYSQFVLVVSIAFCSISLVVFFKISMFFLGVSEESVAAGGVWNYFKFLLCMLFGSMGYVTHYFWRWMVAKLLTFIGINPYR
ncbi:hypothetical protein [Chitiniphilus eburneus]|uniref:Uncharacterized protein n=1 Tax=Chitiniphilus eburneus TaxID=2571148 RepID=A0A4U0Q4Y3_9NEIS|nr:hypothetical protein [Chitiniphilus eburneus]TJZ76201.1 hypothetical protein FAZ21_05345 [Chitiniphilus eburneus]